ncbi:MAG: Ig-like domain-containing protein, partial [Acutalibacteraceae bacterium]|nr:Ig-like domain-containing protein [Acutalibacteraceae bacterium]
TNSHTIYGLVETATYNFRVRGIKNSAWSGMSNVANCNISRTMPTSVNITKSSVSICVGNTYKLKAEVSPLKTSQSVNWSSSNTSVATVDADGTVTAKKAGTVTITAKSSLDSSKKASCTVTVISRYQYELKSSYGFSDSMSELIISVYKKVDNVYSNETNLERAWRCARLLSEFCFDDGFQWDDVASSVTKLENRKQYFVDTLGYTSQQYDSLNTALTKQYRDANNYGTLIDFCHMQYSLAARLAYSLGKTGDASNWLAGLKTGNMKYYSDEEISYLGGWLGDAVLTGYNGGTTSLGNDDYMSDLDAENIYHIVLQGYSSIEAISNYYSSLSSTNNRSHVFTSHISFETVRDMVFYELIDADLIYLKTYNPENEDYYSNLLNDEDYHWNILKNQYHDTYNFLCSLRDHRPNSVNY